MKLILNEKEMVEKSLNEGYIDKKPTVTIKLLIKHFFSQGMDKIQVKASLDAFLKEKLTKYNSVKWDDILTKFIKQYEKDYSLTVIENVKITSNELNITKQIDNIELEKLAFTYLVYSKIYNQINKNHSDWVNADRKEIFKDSKVNASVNKQRLMVNDLITLKLIESSRRNNCSNKKVLFADHDSEPEIIIDDFRDFIYFYLRWKGERIGNCENCKKLFKLKNNKMKYCGSCAKYIKNKQNKSYYHSKNK